VRADTEPLSGGQFSTAFPKSDLEWTIHRAEQIPGPGEYEVKNADAQLFSAGHTGKFNFRLKPTEAPIEKFSEAVNAVKVLNKASAAAQLFGQSLSANRFKAAAAAMANVDPANEEGAASGGGDGGSGGAAAVAAAAEATSGAGGGGGEEEEEELKQENAAKSTGA
jgi:hypothetical protein